LSINSLTSSLQSYLILDWDGTMKRYLMPILAMLVLASALLVCCSANGERDAAVVFYQELYPITLEMRQIVDEWNAWNLTASQLEYEQKLFDKSKYYEGKLSVLSARVIVLYAPKELRHLKDLTVTALNKGIGSLRLAQEYALTGDESHRLQADSAQLEYNRLVGLAADEYDDGLARYKIKPSEIVK